MFPFNTNKCQMAWLYLHFCHLKKKIPATTIMEPPRIICSVTEGIFLKKELKKKRYINPWKAYIVTIRDEYFDL